MIEKALVTTEWLADRLGHPRLRVVDGSMYLPTSGRDAAAEYAAAHLPGAVFFDLEATSDRRSSLPHMLPAAADFAERMSALGLDDADDIVVYDGSGANLSAARVWWMFRVFSHDRVAVLDGGIGKWRREGRPVESQPPTRPRGMLVLSGQSSGPVGAFDPQLLNQKGSLFLTRPTLAHYVPTRAELLHRAGELLGWVADGSLAVRIGLELPLAAAAEAHTELEARRTTGKVLLIP